MLIDQSAGKWFFSLSISLLFLYFLFLNPSRKNLSALVRLVSFYALYTLDIKLKICDMIDLKTLLHISVDSLALYYACGWFYKR